MRNTSNPTKGFKKYIFLSIFAIVGVGALIAVSAAGEKLSVQVESSPSLSALAKIINDASASNNQYVVFGGGLDPRYNQHLQVVKTQSVRNKHHDNSPFKNTPQANLDISDSPPQLGPRSAYLGNPNGNPEQDFPTTSGGQNRTSCEFSHFAYDDPVIFPNQAGKAHLHMFFGNTDVNAYSTYSTLINSGSSTCNGQELNRTGYWAPAMIDGDGMVRIPERVVVYYKAEGLVRGKAKPYKPGMANVSPNPVTVVEYPRYDGGEPGEVNYKCSNNFSAYPYAKGVEEIPNCSGDYWKNTYGAPYPETRTILEMEIKFWYCFPPNADPTDYTKWQPAGKTRGQWFYGNCDGQGGQDSSAGAPPLNDKEHYPTLIYYINYVVEPGDNTSDWFLSSDVDAATIKNTTPTLKGARGSTHHADWWGGWHPTINKEFLDNCTNYKDPSGAASGCGFGYLSNGGPNGGSPYPDRALKYRPQYDQVGNGSSYKFPLSTLFDQICKPLGPGHNYTSPRSGAYCKP